MLIVGSGTMSELAGISSVLCTSIKRKLYSMVQTHSLRSTSGFELCHCCSRANGSVGPLRQLVVKISSIAGFLRDLQHAVGIPLYASTTCV